MNTKIILTKKFTKEFERFQKKGLLLIEDFQDFLQELSKNPEAGDVIPGLGGVRKIRLKSATKGKRGGFRVCYHFLQINDIVYLLEIYAKNDQEDISANDKKILKNVVILLKRGQHS